MAPAFAFASMTSDRSPHLTLSQVAEILALPDRAIRVHAALRRLGVHPYTIARKEWRVHRDDLELALAKRRQDAQEPTAPPEQGAPTP